MWGIWDRWRRWRQGVSGTEARILTALAEGWTLKAQRSVDGEKVYWLLSLTGEREPVGAGVVERLMSRRLLSTNHKFPANTYLLTEKGRKIAGILAGQPVTALSPRNYFEEG